MLDSIQAKNRSYDIDRTVKPGDRIIAIQQVRYRSPIEKGTGITIKSTFNAGFRGIEVSGYTDDGKHVHGLSLGYFTPDWMF